jgi:hypothetical protein
VDVTHLLSLLALVCIVVCSVFCFICCLSCCIVVGGKQFCWETDHSQFRCFVLSGKLSILSM